MDALELLKSDHEMVADLFDQVRETDESEHAQLFEQIKTELETHTHIEERVFYPRLKEEGDEELVDIVLEGIEEHKQVKTLLKELSSLSSDSEKFEPKLKVLMENVEHHVEEEESEMFPLIESQFDTEMLDQMGAALAAEKKAFRQEQSAGAAN